MKVLLTGAAGFVGAHVARVLVRERCDVFALVRPRTDIRRLGSLADRMDVIEADLQCFSDIEQVVRRVKPEACIHLAWCTEPGKYLESAENLDLIGASINLARALHAAGCGRLVAAGTCFEYDTDAGYLTETTVTEPKTLYSAAKHALHIALERFSARTGLKLAWLRLFYLYGPGEHPARLVPSVIRSLLTRRQASITSGEQVRDFLHVEDVAEAFWAATLNDFRGALNVGSGQPVTVRLVAETIARLMNRPDLLRIGGLAIPPGEPPFICANNGRLRQETGWRPRIDLDSGVLSTIQWWKSRQEQDVPSLDTSRGDTAFSQ